MPVHSNSQHVSLLFKKASWVWISWSPLLSVEAPLTPPKIMLFQLQRVTSASFLLCLDNFPPGLEN